jgi:hypothetical protein
MVTRHNDVMSKIEEIYCFWCNRVKDHGCYCYNPDAAALVARTPHHVAVKTAETAPAHRARLAAAVAASRPAKRRRSAA